MENEKLNSRFFNRKVLSKEELAFYDDQGYLLIKDILTSEGVEHMRNQCMQAWVEEKGEFDPEKTWLQNSLLVNIHHRARLVRDYYFDGPLVDVATQIIGPNIKGATAQLTFKMRGNTKPFGWHQDNGYGELDPYNALTTLTALDDTDQSNGCLWLIPGSHKQGQITVMQTREMKQKATEIVIGTDESNAVPMEMKAGDCLIFNCWTLHKSEGNFSRDRDRRVLFLRYADANAVEVYNDNKPRLGRLLRGVTRFPEVAEFECDL